ncbi:uncharacterized protein BP5553_09934 [Venustampulla echinocandica]|uniref:Uncharacterized protein n=1 Tax=Venustampulla echinocandica TaxID=2656787 RepID=A0A370TB44_9HELO|nr:uncharacterized protein BP5553_09934 [Venustampulla echinocandica]RDL31145.1 hypothetical protein BP5553_09934 [Venustampulla echinocandica]
MKSIVNLVALVLTFLTLSISTSASPTNNGLATNEFVYPHQILKRSYNLDCAKLVNAKVCTALGVACDQNGNVLNARSPDLPKHCGPLQCVCTPVGAGDPLLPKTKTIRAAGMDSMMTSQMSSMMATPTNSMMASQMNSIMGTPASNMIGISPSIVTGSEPTSLAPPISSITATPSTGTMAPPPMNSILPTSTMYMTTVVPHMHTSRLEGSVTGTSTVVVTSITLMTTSITPTASTSANDAHTHTAALRFYFLSLAVFLAYAIQM